MTFPLHSSTPPPIYSSSPPPSLPFPNSLTSLKCGEVNSDSSGESGVTQEQSASSGGTARTPYQKVLSESYYGLLGLHPSASAREIRQAYRDLSKLYHPDTTTLPTTIATTKFQQLNEAYATLSSPERRSVYDRKIGYSSVAVVQPMPSLQRSPSRQPTYSSSAYLDPTDRPLSPGELFALFILGITFIGCLCLAIAIGLTRGTTVLPTAQAVTSLEARSQPVTSTETSPKLMTAPAIMAPAAINDSPASSTKPPAPSQ